MIAMLPYLFCMLLSGAIFVIWRGRAVLDDKLRHEIASRATAEATLAAMEEELSRLRDETAANIARYTMAEKNEAVAAQKVAAAEQRIREFEQLKGQFEQYAKAAALETGNQLSNKLMADHVREREAAHEQFKQFTTTARDELLQKQQELATTLGTVQGQVNDSRQQLSTLVRAMQNPIGAGAEGEIVMSNMLAQHGFTQGVDYELQVHLAAEEGALRPDCVIYLPHAHAIILDSKASQHIFALFRAEGTPEFDNAFRDIQKTMREHAKALASKAYQEHLRKLKNRNGEPITRTTLVMFIPNDAVVTRLIHQDPNLMQYLREQDIVLAGPVTLSGLFLTARALVREAKQKDDAAAIIELTSELMSDFIVSLSYAEGVVKGIKTSAEAYDKFGGSLRNVLAKMKRLNAKGVSPAKNKAIPARVTRYTKMQPEDDVVQGEAEELVEVLQISKDVA